MNTNYLTLGHVINRRICYLIAVLFLIVGCTSVSLVASYDKQTDDAITALQRKFETFYINLEDQVGTDAADYQQHRAFYQQLKVDISAINLRALALPNNEDTQDAIVELSEIVEELKEVHKEGIVHIDALKPGRDSINTSLHYILKLELAKKHRKES